MSWASGKAGEGGLVDCRPGQQKTNGQLDWLIAKQPPTQCKCCHVELPMFRKPNEIDICSPCVTFINLNHKEGVICL